MRHGSLFSGIGGFDLAAEWMGWENVFHCEWNEFGRKVLNNYWPKSISYEDITKVDFRHHRGVIDILTGGFPCQPYSNAGKRLGTDDDRHLWPEMLRAIREIQPSYVVGENVRGLTNWNGGLVFDEVQADLEAEGYEVLPFLLPACAINAPHRRDRIWFVAYSDDERAVERVRNKRERKEKDEGLEGQPQPKLGACSVSTTESDCGGLEGTIKVGRNCVNVEGKSKFGIATNSNDKLRQRWDERTEERRENEGKRAEPLGDDKQGHAPDTTDQRLERKRRGKRELEGGFRPTVSNTQNHKPTTWKNFPTQSPICGGNDGLPTKLDGITFPKWRNESIKAYGNAIVPQVAFEIFKAIEKQR